MNHKKERMDMNKNTTRSNRACRMALSRPTAGWPPRPRHRGDPDTRPSGAPRTYRLRPAKGAAAPEGPRTALALAVGERSEVRR
jgi:hypothetical protein